MQPILLAFGLLPSVPPPRAGAIASADRVALGPRMATEVNPSIAAATPCAFPWWSDECSALIAELDAKGGERFVASHDEEGYDTRNWLHVTSSSPLRRAQWCRLRRSTRRARQFFFLAACGIRMGQAATFSTWMRFAQTAREYGWSEREGVEGGATASAAA